MRTAELQSRLRALGFDPGPTDGLYGELTEEAVFDALDKYTPLVELVPEEHVVPQEWMPSADMERIVCHWTAGAWKASSHDVNYYHILIEDDGKLVRGAYSIKDNVNTGDGRYAPHTKNCNTGSIGVSVCCMANAVENPFDAGKYPMTETQWKTLATVVADLCHNYSIPVTERTVLSHAEVQGTLGISQSGKWDYTRLAFDASCKGAKACGDRLRNDVSVRMQIATNPAKVETTVSPTPTVIP